MWVESYVGGARNGNMVKGADVDNVDFIRTPSLKNTRFTEFLIRKNALDKGGFKGWVFCPGMLFNSTDKWWGDQGKRDKPHEGLDLCLYKDREDKILRLGEKAKVPVIYDGIVVRIVDDFLGKSVIIEHILSDFDNNRLCTITVIQSRKMIFTSAKSSRRGMSLQPWLTRAGPKQTSFPICTSHLGGHPKESHMTDWIGKT